MINRCIFKDATVFECVVDAVRCIYSGPLCIGGVFQHNSMHL
jgi:hypothetical protein